MDMEKEKESVVKCPSCGEELVLEPKSEDESEDKMNKKPVKKMNAGNMSMGALKDKISKPSPMPPTVSNPPNLNAY